MNNYIEVIGNMENSNNIHLNIYDNINKYYRNIQELINQEVNTEKFSSNIEHTNVGLNLRFIVYDEKTLNDIEAICTYANLEKVKTQKPGKYTWIRFKME
jgi:hypothetical protein